LPRRKQFTAKTKAKTQYRFVGLKTSTPTKFYTAVSSCTVRLCMDKKLLVTYQ